MSYRSVFFISSLALLCGVALSACSSVGMGFVNHPTDCAIGIAWADCLPGTAGYANGGGSIHRQAAADIQASESAQTAAFERTLQEQCELELKSPAIDPIRSKVEISKATTSSPVPFLVAANSDYPNPAERDAIAAWASVREGCIRRSDALYTAPMNNAIENTRYQIDKKFITDTNANVGQLIVALYQGKMTYGEFAQKRYEIGQTMTSARLQYREAALSSDQQRRMQLEQIAQQRIQNETQSWNNFVQSVNSRRSVNCTSTRYGNTVSTNCN